MVQEIQLDMVLDKCSPKEFYNLMYGSDVGIKKFHSEVYKSDNVDVSEWEDGRRVVGCTMPVAIPDVLKSIVGTDKIPIVESQNLTIQDNGEFQIESSPVPQIPGGSKFTTFTKVMVRANELSSCKIIVEVSCSAAGPWGLVSVIESVMVEQARVGMKGFLDFCGREFNHRQISAESLILDEPKSSVSEDTSEFQDALSEASNADTNPPIPMESGHINGPETVLVDNLRKLVGATENIQKELKDLSVKLNKLQEFQCRQSRKQFWMHFAIGTCCAALVWQQIRHR